MRVGTICQNLHRIKADADRRTTLWRRLSIFDARPCFENKWTREGQKDEEIGPKEFLLPIFISRTISHKSETTGTFQPDNHHPFNCRYLAISLCSRCKEIRILFRLLIKLYKRAKTNYIVNKKGLKNSLSR